MLYACVYQIVARKLNFNAWWEDVKYLSFDNKLYHCEKLKYYFFKKIQLFLRHIRFFET